MEYTCVSPFSLTSFRLKEIIAHIVYTDNEHRQRMKALDSMSSPGYRSEVLGSDIVDYIINGRLHRPLLELS